MTGTISIVDLELQCRIGVGEAERAVPQRLLISVAMDMDITAAAATDDLAHTVDYDALSQDLRAFCAQGEWRLIEKLAGDLVARIVARHRPLRTVVEIKKFVLPQTRHVSVRVEHSLREGN
ncbi:MAG: dihydroneopterin aldolase [Pedosphaera sp.]|nr:dihydroneopterin aldolase [Pedosphaera sp.]MSU44266.1 dihydroneopterin aldolase [Pedosphaera sp.]